MNGGFNKPSVDNNKRCFIHQIKGEGTPRLKELYPKLWISGKSDLYQTAPSGLDHIDVLHGTLPRDFGGNGLSTCAQRFQQKIARQRANRPATLFMQDILKQPDFLGREHDVDFLILLHGYGYRRGYEHRQFPLESYELRKYILSYEHRNKGRHIMKANLSTNPLRQSAADAYRRARNCRLHAKQYPHCAERELKSARYWVESAGFWRAEAERDAVPVSLPPVRQWAVSVSWQDELEMLFRTAPAEVE